MFFHVYKNSKKTCIKTLNYSIHDSSKKHRQYESNKVNNTATKHSLCPGNRICLTLTRPEATQFSTFIFLQQQKHFKKILKNIKLLNFYKKNKKRFLHPCR